ncbi:citrate:proton symporter [Burkholderia ubonensis]|uniref:MFS transporter n=1 Tax=Burkholderia ubonensis TaxID=101571 RepID=UPI000758C28B|nr:MFS transporter [Burkholderia ubonensis]KVD55495.1 citrate:proton symporter [Burkholderia ubonensis]KVT79477.1 citrate:proton symporter [Burkholderia ubonensis]
MKQSAVPLDTAAAASPPASPAGRAIAAASIGNALEWYDFSVYAFFAVYIAQNFFHRGDAGTQLVEAFMAFGIGFIARPLGALAIGVYGDRAGRKAALTLTILVMAAGTGIIAFAPPFTAIGVGAPLLILCGRLLQGFSAGGEVGGAAAFLIEHAPADRKGMYASWLQASMAASNILGALVATTVTLTLSHEQIGDWGWRIPFILGLAIAPVGLWLRKTLDETPHFRAEMARAQREHAARKAPLLQVVRDYPRELAIGTGFSVLWAVCIYALVIYMPTHAQRALHFDGRDAFIASLVGNCLMAVTCVCAGGWSDRFGRRTVLAAGAALMIVSVYPLLNWLNHTHTLAALVAVQSAFCVMVAIFTGVAPAALSELFPTSVRATGMSLAYNLAATFFGGFAPAILAWLTQQTGSPFAPAWYVMAAGAIALASITALPSTPRHP